jgi:hypothetical protein
MALIDESEPEDRVPSPSVLVELRANRVIENFGMNKRDARLVVAVAEQLGKVINLKDDDDEPKGDDGNPKGD